VSTKSRLAGAGVVVDRGVAPRHDFVREALPHGRGRASPQGGAPIGVRREARDGPREGRRVAGRNPQAGVVPSTSLTPPTSVATTAVPTAMARAAPSACPRAATAARRCPAPGGDRGRPALSEEEDPPAEALPPCLLFQLTPQRALADDREAQPAQVTEESGRLDEVAEALLGAEPSHEPDQELRLADPESRADPRGRGRATAARSRPFGMTSIVRGGSRGRASRARSPRRRRPPGRTRAGTRRRRARTPATRGSRASRGGWW